jgi:hypothetical protein
VPWLLLADGVALVHGAFVAYVVVGGLVALRWPRTLALHVVAAAWGLLVIAASVRCPLTTAEDWLRVRGGEAPLAGGFIDRYVEGVLYPASLTPLVQALVAALVLGSWAVLLTRSRVRTPAASGPGSPR